MLRLPKALNESEWATNLWYKTQIHLVAPPKPDLIWWSDKKLLVIQYIKEILCSMALCIWIQKLAVAVASKRTLKTNTIFSIVIILFRCSYLMFESLWCLPRALLLFWKQKLCCERALPLLLSPFACAPNLFSVIQNNESSGILRRWRRLQRAETHGKKGNKQKGKSNRWNWVINSKHNLLSGE